MNLARVFCHGKLLELLFVATQAVAQTVHSNKLTFLSLSLIIKLSSRNKSKRVEEPFATQSIVSERKKVRHGAFYAGAVPENLILMN